VRTAIAATGQMEEISAKLSALLCVIDENKIDVDFNAVEEAYATGAPNVGELESILNKALGLENMGSYQDALSEYARYFAALQKQGMDTSRFYSELGDASKKQGKFEDALKFYRKALALQLAGLPADHPDVAASYCGIGCAYHGQSKYDEALSFYQKALKIRLATLGHNYVGDLFNRMANVYESQGKYTEALDLYQKTLDINLVELGPEHPSTKIVEENIAVCLENLKSVP
jgi:tetratricopeptide (TPR) repeat protein